MFNLNENNRIVMAQHPSDMRMGARITSLVRIIVEPKTMPYSTPSWYRAKYLVKIHISG